MGASQDEHLTDHQLLAFLERTLGPTEQARVEGHLADCLRCRDDLLSTTRVRRARRTRRYATVGIPAAAAAVLALLLLGPATPGRVQAPRVRAGAEAPAAVLIVSPADGATLRATPIVFVWRNVAQSARYRFTLTNTDGDDIWTADVTDTTATLPDTVSLLKTQTYFWYVDVFLPNGTSLTSEVHGFNYTP